MDTQTQQFDPYEGYEDGPLTTAVYFGAWALYFMAAMLGIVGAFMVSPGAGLVMIGIVAGIVSQMLVPYYVQRVQVEQRDYAIRRVAQHQKQQQVAAQDAARQMMADAERDARRI